MIARSAAARSGVLVGRPAIGKYLYRIIEAAELNGMAESPLQIGLKGVSLMVSVEYCPQVGYLLVVFSTRYEALGAVESG